MEKHEFKSYREAQNFADDHKAPNVWCHVYRLVVAGYEKFVVDIHPVRKQS
jgi:hypothetical protein